MGPLAAGIPLLLVGAHTHTPDGPRCSGRSKALGVGLPRGRLAGWPSPAQSGTQRDECISLPAKLCPAPLPHLKGAVKVEEGKQEVPPIHRASIETSRYIFTYFFPGFWDEAEISRS